MSTPMWEVPDHFPIDVDAAGHGPAEGGEVVARVCWCGDDSCELWKEDQ